MIRSDLRIRRAVLADVPAIVALLADDELGSVREPPWEAAAQRYRDVLAEIDSDPHQLLCVADVDGPIVGTLQLTFIAGLSRNGSKRGLIEAVRIARERRGERLGDALLAWAIDTCRARGCALVQLTTDKRRLDAHRFYERLGFEPSHLGYKRQL